MKKLNFFATALLLKLTRSVFVTLSIWTMVFSPVAYGAQAAKQFDQITQNELKQLVINLGLNKRMTYKEFWEKTKHLYPTKVHRDVEATFLSQPSALMPKFEVTFTQDSSGKKVPTLKITDRGNTTNVQIIGELNEWARVNGVSLSESDLKQIRPALEKLNPATVQLETYKKDFNRFTGFPRMTPELWKSLKPEARARYIIEMRLLWFEARRVIEANSPSAKFIPANPKQKKSPINPKQKGKKTSSFEEFIRVFIGQDAEAQTTAIAEADQILQDYKKMAPAGYGGEECTPPGATSSSAKGCVVAGQVARDGAKYYTAINSNSTTEAGNCACSYHSVLVQRYVNAPQDKKEIEANYLIQQSKYNKRCTELNEGSREGIYVACNPSVYSFDPATGDPFCMNAQSRQFQNATSYSSGVSNQPSCDEQSRLGPNPSKFEKEKIDVLKNRSAALDIIASDADSEKMAKRYLDGLLKHKQKHGSKLGGGKSISDLLLDPKSSYDSSIDEFMVDTQLAYEAEISEAMRLCVQNAKGNPDKNHGEACKQLHRRWLFTEKVIERYRSKACIDGSVYIGALASNDTAESKAEKALLNKTKAASTAKMCKCADGNLVGFDKMCDKGNRNGAELAPCPGTSQIYGHETCRCPSGAEFLRTEDEKVNVDEYLNVCHPGESRDTESGNCDVQYPGATPVDPMTCICQSGSREGELPIKLPAVEDRSPKTSKTTITSETETTTTESVTVPAAGSNISADKWACNQTGWPWWTWVLAGLGLAAVYKLFKKKDTPPNYTCSEGPNFRYNQQLGLCYCPLKDTCPGGLYNADCSACVPQPVCTPPKSKGSYPACSCPNTCLMGTNHPVTCECEEGGNGNVNPDNNGGGLPPATPVGR